MIRIMEGDTRKLKDPIENTKFLLTGNIDGELLPEAELIPFDVSGRLVPQAISINELGKQLLKASGEGNVSEIRTLMNKGAPFTADWLGTSPLHLAAQNNHLEICEILLRAGISKDAITKVARTPLHMAAYEGHIEIVECLLKHGADYDCRDMLEMTPLHWAAQNGHAEIVALLIKYGASTNPVNKFDLTPADLALQIKRQDIVEIINVAIRDPLIATQHLQLEMTSDSNDTMDVSEIRDSEVNYVPMQTVSMEDDSEGSMEQEQLNMPAETEAQIHDLTEEIDEPQANATISDSIKYLQEHGITMLPADDSSILTTVMESGHSVILTEVGKQVLNSIKQSDAVNISSKINQKSLTPKESNVTTVNMKKIITVTPEEFLAMTTNGTLSNNFIKQVNNKLVTIPKTNMKRIVMKKNKTTPITATINVPKVQKAAADTSSDVETLKKQLIEANKLIEEYKIKLRKKELEADRYRQQLKLLLEAQ